jgi:hypothetical protein
MVHKSVEAVLEDNAFIDNNICRPAFLVGFTKPTMVGNYSLAADNLVTSTGYKTVDARQGAIVGGGIIDGASQSTLIDNTVCTQRQPR